MDSKLGLVAKTATPPDTTATDPTLQNRALPVPPLGQWLPLLFALIAALAVANVYFAQPLLATMAKSLEVRPGLIGMLVTMTQVGYALGLLFIVPLGDRINRKNLLIAQITLSAAALTIAGFSQHWMTLLTALFFVGLMAVVVQLVVAYAASLSTPSTRGKAVGTVTSGVVLGILLARFTSGVVADIAGWRAVYLSSAGLMLVLAGVIYKVIPSSQTLPMKGSYWTLMLSVCKLFKTETTLWVRGIFALFIFAAFSVLWTSMVLPLSAQSLSQTQIGSFGLAGIAGALAAAKAGQWADRGLGQRTTGLSLVLLIFSWLPIAYAETSLLLLLAGIVVLDFAVQAVHVTNQSLILAARPDAPSRLVGAYMCFYSAGSALGAIAATQVYSLWGWHAVCLLGAAISAAALVFWFGSRK
ncbi:MFS transporter [Biostraticola tofi]|uniref:Putative MFS family arabinose efflux permease n=1 Tax=Biostraticola tofi TaxID=466109 RepID=A0A4R3YKJ5_9GAMM|nr:putative MFS family arabinose efflux permease [Biostraticola tofi]